MPKFGMRSQERLNSCHPSLWALFTEVIQHYDCTILCGHREKAEQTKAVREKKSQLPWPESKHNRIPSQAVDVVPWYSDEPHIRWLDTKKIHHFAGFVLGVAATLRISLRWGGDWDSDTDLNDQDFCDLAHFELGGRA